MGFTILITGGAGFIGSTLIRQLTQETDFRVVNVDKLTYAGNLDTLEEVSGSPRYSFEHIDICQSNDLHRVFQEHQPDVVIHLAAESHVDRSIDGPADFVNTNIIGTYNLLEIARDYWGRLSSDRRNRFRFHHVSTDEVYGSIEDGRYSTEETPYRPNSPYSASKAASDHLVRAWHKTYHLPIVITNSSNNYGPFQFPEKLIPLMILSALDGKQLPIYGDGKHVRDWLYVDDHCRALRRALSDGKVGEIYNIGGHNQKTNLEVVHQICTLLDELHHKVNGNSYRDQIDFVVDRPGHDRRYAIDAAKIQETIGWKPQETFESGLRKTVQWYLKNREWCRQTEKAHTALSRKGLPK